jgi:predicted AAA+ superfamily ATPase
MELFPVVALLGPRQIGKTTLARQVLQRHPGAIALDLEKPSERRKLDDPERFLRAHADKLVCLDEIQLVPELFPVLRSLIDEARRPGRFLILGSAAPALLRQGAETLAGRIGFIEMGGIGLTEWSGVEGRGEPQQLWQRGGFPASLLASSERSSCRWRQAFIQTFLERDLPQLGFPWPAASLEKFWTMCAHLHGQPLNLSDLGRSLGCSHVTIRSQIDALVGAFILRSLPSLEANIGKQIVKSPRIYLRDSGLLHQLLGIADADSLFSHPVCGASWEGFVVENLLSQLEPEGWKGFYHRARSGSEIDLILRRGQRLVAVECKASSAPVLSRGFYEALDDLKIAEAYVAAPVDSPYPLKQGITAGSPLAIAEILLK